ncbi:armadillo segment polarity protein [Tetranychus urticae]|uniref:Armadillo segment polarity protein n=1 Tax=Tetranychus urticae TaxID=32264 RepID=T1KGW2_TETUR|nr:armadillo segment polarity protein [Tetranychus urticae]
MSFSNFTTKIPEIQATDSGFSSAAPSIIDDEFLASFDFNYEGKSSHTLPPFQSTPEPMSPVPMLDVQTSSDVASQAIPTLIDLLSDEDPFIQNKACNMVLQLSTEKVSRETIINSPGMIVALLEALSKTNDIEIIENGVGILYNLSEHRQGRLTIYKLGGIFELVRMLSCNSESVVHLAITALHLLLLHQEGSKEAVRDANGLPPLISLLQNQNEQFLSIVTDCIRLLVYGDSESKIIMQRLGGTTQLLQILQTVSYPNLLWVISNTLKVLSACQENKRTIIENGGLQALAMHLNTQLDSHVSNCLFTIRNLSDAAVFQNDLHLLLSNTMDILRFALTDQVTQENIITCVAGILSNLTCNVINKQIVRQMGGVELLIGTVIKFGSKEEITEPAICALRHLTCRYIEAELASNAILDCEGLGPIISLLKTNSWPLKKAVVGLLRNLALLDANIVPLRDHYAIENLAEVLNEAKIASRSVDLGAGVVPMDAPLIPDPKIEAIIEEAAATLKIMAKDPLSKHKIQEKSFFFEEFIVDIFNTSIN